MKILLISPLTGIVGGISVWTSNIMKFLSKRNDINVVLCDFSRNLTGQMISNPFLRVFFAIRDYFKLTRHAIVRLNEFDGDVIHLCSSASYLLIRDLVIVNAAKKRGLKVCLHFHFGRIPELYRCKDWEWRLLKRLVSKVDISIVMDQESYQVLKEQKSRVHLLPNPLSNDVQEIIKNTKVDKEQRVILFAGHCIPSKGVYELVEACRQITNIKLRMVGAISAEIKERLMILAGENNEWLEIIGQVSHEDTIKYMKSCDIFVLPTYTEGFPNVIIESMACGCPIVASEVGAIPEMLREENGKHYGITIQPKDSNQIKIAIEHFLSDPCYKDECARNAQNRVRELYNIESVGNKLISIWEN